MLKKSFFGIIFILSVLCNVYASENVLLSVDDTHLVVGQTTRLSVTVANIKASSPPELLNFENFEVNFIGTSSNISIINGVYKSEKIFNYAITPRKSGSFEVGPAIVASKNKKYKSNKINIIVENNSNNINKKKYSNLFIEVTADKKEAKLNEEINLSIKIFRRVNIFNMSIKPPEMNEFVVYKLGDAKDYEEVKNGRKYYVSELKYALFPTETGTLTIEPFILNGDVVLSGNPLDSFFKNPFVGGDSKRISIPSNAISIKVLPLEKNVYAVGDYDFSYASNVNETKVGQSFTVTLKVFGYGNLNLSENLKLPETKGLKYYPDKPSVKIKRRGSTVYSEKIEKIAIIPEKAGNFEIPGIPISFYNPVSGKYEDFVLPAIALKVFPDDKDNLKVVESKNKEKVVVKKGEDISTIKPVELKNENVILNLKKVFFFFGFPLVLYFILMLFKYFYLLKKVNYKKILKNSAYSKLKKELSSADSVEKIANVLREYFANKTENFNKFLTFKEISEILKEKGLEQESMEKLNSLFSEIEKAQFAGLKSLNTDELKKLLLEITNKIDGKL